MQRRHLAFLVFALVCIYCTVAAEERHKPLSGNQASGSNEGSYVQITSVTVDPVALHKSQKPDAATVTVQVVAVGKVAPDATLTVEVATSSAFPDGNNVTYSKTQTIALNKSPTVLRFTATPDKRTLAGKLTVFADIRDARGVAQVKDPALPGDALAELKTLVP